jgi:hypothetical protein
MPVSVLRGSGIGSCCTVWCNYIIYNYIIILLYIIISKAALTSAARPSTPGACLAFYTPKCAIFWYCISCHVMSCALHDQSFRHT